jgi:hypothetical protein
MISKFIFERPPYTGNVELPGQKRRFEVRVVVRYDHKLTMDGKKLDARRVEALSDVMEDTIATFSERVKAILGPDFLIDERPLQTETVGGVEGGMIYILGVDFFHKEKP